MLRSLQRELTLDAVTSILDYGRHAASWQFVGTGGTPFFDPSDLADAELDGLIGGEPETLSLLATTRPEVKTVSLDAAPKNTSLAVVTHDNHAIGRMGGEYLLGRGFAQFAFVGHDQELTSRQRLEGFRQVIEGAGRPCRSILYAERKRADSPNERAVIRRLLGKLPKPIAIMTVLDYLARLTVTAAVDLGLRVPDEVAVLGVNNNVWTSVLAALPVSSIQLNMRQLGYTAAETLDALMKGGPPPGPRYVPPLGVVTRHSTDVTLVDDPLVRRATTFIRDHAAEGISVEDVLDALGVSRSTLVNRMKAATGQTTQQAIRRAQVDRVKQMLMSTELTMDQISRGCGFQCQPRLNEAFKRLTGMTPGQFRQQCSR